MIFDRLNCTFRTEEPIKNGEAKIFTL